ncbi:chemotaxis protein CheW [Curvibacter sp. PAE-UM]|uniref:chemotaxis protein CheW n=1 Tax=Curvibacter sp. PAE-UM TaxID=1714344 RepID=UPI00070D1F5B|nr:chemotaxis protein CheW [Curvibacter sp. PAE-UM]KRH99682.1 chemotaxis protein CheW [Curvibacter sp. PAE-UM]
MSTQTTTQDSVAAQRTAGQQAESTPSIREFLAFKLGREEYGIDILRVQEIRSYEQPTRMANAPSFILGVMNLRGVIVPIIDMRIKFGLAEVKYDNFTVVIVLNIGTQVVGMVVDAVSDVIALTPEQQRPVPEFSAAIDSNQVMAIGSVQDRMLVLLDIEKVMGRADMGLVTQSVQ